MLGHGASMHMTSMDERAHILHISLLHAFAYIMVGTTYSAASAATQGAKVYGGATASGCGYSVNQRTIYGSNYGSAI